MKKTYEPQLKEKKKKKEKKVIKKLKKKKKKVCKLKRFSEWLKQIKKIINTACTRWHNELNPHTDKLFFLNKKLLHSVMIAI